MAEDIHIIACSVFKNALTRLIEGHNIHPASTIIYLPSNLHLHPETLKVRLLDTIEQATAPESRLVCLYGLCFPEIDRYLEPAGVSRISCSHCYEILLGSRRYNKLMADCPGTFFVENELLLDFDALCRVPLELDDPVIRDMYFSHYRQVVYIRQPLDSDLTGRAQEVAQLLNLRLTVMDADYAELNRFLKNLGS